MFFSDFEQKLILLVSISIVYFSQKFGKHDKSQNRVHMRCNKKLAIDTPHYEYDTSRFTQSYTCEFRKMRIIGMDGSLTDWRTD